MSLQSNPVVGKLNEAAQAEQAPCSTQSEKRSATLARLARIRGQNSLFTVRMGGYSVQTPTAAIPALRKTPTRKRLINHVGGQMSQGITRFRTLLRKRTRQCMRNTRSNSIVTVSRELEECTRQICPKDLYRYRPTTHLLTEVEDIRNGVVFLSPASGFQGDLWDGVPFIDTDQMIGQIRTQCTQDNLLRTIYNDTLLCTDNSVIAHLEALADEVKTHYPECLDAFVQRMSDSCAEKCKRYRDSFRIVCFTERNDLPNMWDRYAESGQGYVVEYHFSSDSHILCSCNYCCCLSGSQLLPIYPVLYDGVADLTPLSHVIMSKHYSPWLPTTADLLAQINALVHKKECWSHEREWRLVATSCDEKAFSAAQGIMHANLEAKGIYLGYNISNDYKAALLSVAEERTIPVYQTIEDHSTPESNFGFKRVM